MNSDAPQINGPDEVKQLNIVVPFALREPLKKIAAACRNGKPVGLTLFLHGLSYETPSMTESRKTAIWRIVKACSSNAPLDKMLRDQFLEVAAPGTRARFELLEKIEKNKDLYNLALGIHRLPKWQRRFVEFLVSRA